MKRMIMGATIIALLTSSAAVARSDRDSDRHQQNHGSKAHQKSERANNGGHRGWGRERGRNHRWSRGERMGYGDWRNAEHIDYRRYHLRQPPRGYEWRRSNDRFVLVAVVSGVILSVILVGRR